MPPNPAWRSLTRQDFRLGFSNCVTQPEQPEHSCRLQLLHSPMTAEPYREKTRPLRPRRSCFAPAETHPEGWVWVEAPGTAPGSEWFIATAIYFHSRRTGPFNMGATREKNRAELTERGREPTPAFGSMSPARGFLPNRRFQIRGVPSRPGLCMKFGHAMRRDDGADPGLSEGVAALQSQKLRSVAAGLHLPTVRPNVLGFAGVA